MGRGLVVKLSLICLILFCASTVKAQQDGNISGTVVDEKNAVIVGAQVTVTNDKTGLKRTATSKSNGSFSIQVLPVGIYTVKIEATGFKTVEHKNVDLHVAEDKVLPTVLEIGQVTETVEVQGGAAQVELTTGEVSSLIHSEQVKELPLNNRSFVQLTLLVPGASPSDSITTHTGLLAGVDISMSGSPANANAWLVDGVDNVDHGSGRTILVYPSVDSIQEFKVQNNSYGPEMASAGGAQVNLVTKAGSNAFHGSVYEFLRNDALDATNFFLNAGGAPKAELRFNNFGYTIGGPIKKNKAFFFWSEEWRRELRGVARQSTVPTLLEREGNFSGPHSGDLPTPTNPFTGNAFPNNAIPANLLSPAGLSLMKLYPLPTNNKTVNNWVAAPVTSIPTRQEQIRGDWNINGKHTLMLRYTQDAWKNPAPNFGAEGGLWGDTGFPTVDSTWDQPSKNAAARLTSTFGATLVNEFQFSYANNRIFITPGLGQDINNEINSKIPQVFPGPADRAHATFWGAPLPGIGANLWNAFPWENGQDLWIFKDDVTKTYKEHTLKFGALFSTNKKDEKSAQSAETPQFWGPTAVPGGAGVGGGWGDPNAPGNGGQVTGNGLADLLLKGAYWGGADEQSTVPESLVRWRDYEFYAADTWRIRPRLTLNYGVRYTYLPQTYQDDNRIGNFLLSLYDPKLGATPLNGMIFPKDLSLPDQGIPGGKANLRGVDVGRALRKNSHNLIAPRFGVAWDPTGAGKWAIRAGVGMFYGRSDLSNPIQGLLANPPFVARIDWGSGRPLDTIPGAPPGGTLGTPNAAADIAGKNQGSYQWNLTVERELFKDAKIEVSYVGNRGHHLPINEDLNYVPSPLRAQYAREQFDTDTALNGDELRLLSPLKGGSSLIYQSYSGNSSYNALQVQFVKRFSRGFSTQLSYSWSKLLALADISCCGGGDSTRLSDPEHPNYDRSLGTYDRTNILSWNAIYRLPTFEKYHPYVRHILGGWEGTGIYSYATGVPLNVTLGTDLVGVFRDRPDLVGNPEGAHNADQWLNPNAFAFPTTLGRLGYAPKGLDRAPSINNVDLALYRNFPLPREGMSVQFRAEFFNALNHTQFLNVDTNFSANTISYDPKTDSLVCANPCNTNANFGRPTRAREPREIQFALKFYF
ncbi:MAG TPA: carboxypeptidase-like regulatory domain-containing protein [Blastocatellia bacterium]|nr:carboxypeptidase-like regulatory domain-containing protein [Blastocatellia bacterium]